MLLSYWALWTQHLAAVSGQVRTMQGKENSPWAKLTEQQSWGEGTKTCLHME